MIVALRLTSLPAADTALGEPSSDNSKYSSVLKELDFQPQLWLTEKLSGELVNLVKRDPVALTHAMVKYALTEGRGSR